MVEQCTAEWRSIWDRPVPADSNLDLQARVDVQTAALHDVMQAIAQKPEWTRWIVFIGEELQRIAKLCTGKAAGCDTWVSDGLMCMPLAWWNAAARLWQAIWDKGGLPQRWTEVRYLLIPKPSGDGHRPLGIASIMWRLGTILLFDI